MHQARLEREKKERAAKQRSRGDISGIRPYPLAVRITGGIGLGPLAMERQKYVRVSADPRSQSGVTRHKR